MDELRTILLVEDNPKDVELTLEAMAENNLANQIFVVRDGLEAMEFLRSDPALKRIPVVVLTSSREENDLINTYELGVNAYVLKPVDFK